jgi:hypothetical protein
MTSTQNRSAAAKRLNEIPDIKVTVVEPWWVHELQFSLDLQCCGFTWKQLIQDHCPMPSLRSKPISGIKQPFWASDTNFQIRILRYQLQISTIEEASILSSGFMLHRPKWIDMWNMSQSQ